MNLSKLEDDIKSPNRYIAFSNYCNDKPLAEFIEKPNKNGWYDWGNDNLYPNHLISLTQRSAIHNAIVNLKVERIMTMCDDAARCFFSEPDTLWCGLLYSNFADDVMIPGHTTVQFRPGYNAPDNNALRKKDAGSDPTQVTYTKRQTNGAVITAVSSVHKNPKYFVTRQLNQVGDVSSLTLLSREKTLQSGYNGCEGSVLGFLEPYARPGYSAQIITNSGSVDTQATYLVESTEVRFGMHGARRKLELGPSSNQKIS